MQGATVKDVQEWLEELAPVNLAEDWDRVGLQCGSLQSKVSKIVTTLTVTMDTVDSAIDRGAELIVTHHPLLFKPLHQLSPESRVGSLLYKMVQNDMACFAIHTNLDKAVGGVNDGLAHRLGLNLTTPLMTEQPKGSPQYKLVTFLPEEAEQAVRDALARAGAGIIGRYTHCAFASHGIGSFRPMADANPYSGTVGELTRVNEIRLETVVGRADVRRVIAALDEAHPYEEVPVDLYPMEQPRSVAHGLGRIGQLEKEMSAREFVLHVKERLNLKQCRVAGDVGKKIHRVAVVGGSGGSMIARAHAAGADALVTGDVDYHDAEEATHLGLLVVDAGHYGTEKHVPHDIARYLLSKAGEFKTNIDVHVFNETDFFVDVE